MSMGEVKEMSDGGALMGQVLRFRVMNEAWLSGDG